MPDLNLNVRIPNEIVTEVTTSSYDNLTNILIPGPQGPAGPAGSIINTGELDSRYFNKTGGIISKNNNSILIDPEGFIDIFNITANDQNIEYDLVATENNIDYNIFIGKNYPLISGQSDINFIGRFRILPIQIPTQSDHPGEKGSITWDENYIYICIDDNYWKRSLLEAW